MKKTKNAIYEGVKDSINSVTKDKKITVEDRELDLRELGIDSLNFIRMIVLIEEQFEIEVDDELLSIDELNTMEKIVQMIQDTMD